MMDGNLVTRPLLALLAFLLALWPAALQSFQEELDPASVDHFRQALEAQKAHQLDRAVEQYQAVITANPKFAEAYLNLGIIFQLKSNYPDSVRCFQQALALKPTLPGAPVLLGISGYMLQDFVSARRALEKALQQNPKERQAGVYLALTLLGLDQPEAAARQLRETARYYPEDLEISYYLGTAYSDGVKKSAQLLLDASRESALYQWAMALSAEQRNETGSAIVSCVKALAIDPNIPQLYTLLAALFEKAGFPDLGRQAAARLRGSAAPVDPGGDGAPAAEVTNSPADQKKDFLEMWAQLGAVHPDPNLPHVADTFVDKLLQKEIAADHTGALRAAVELYEKGDFEAAKLRLASGAGSGAHPWIYAYLLARCDLGEHDFDDAEQVLETSLRDQLQLPSVAILKLEVQSEMALHAYDAVVSRQPDSNAARLLQAKSFAAANNPDKAVELYREALRVSPDLPEIHLAIAQLDADRLNWTEVIEELHKELALSPENGLAIALLAHAYAETDQGKEAIPLLTRVLQRYPKDADALADLGKSFAQQGESRKAIESYEKALAADPSRYRVHYRLFQLYQATRQTDLAQQHLTVFQAEDAKRRARTTVIR